MKAVPYLINTVPPVKVALMRLLIQNCLWQYTFYTQIVTRQRRRRGAKFVYLLQIGLIFSGRPCAREAPIRSSLNQTFSDVKCRENLCAQIISAARCFCFETGFPRFFTSYLLTTMVINGFMERRWCWRDLRVHQKQNKNCHLTWREALL